MNNDSDISDMEEAPMYETTNKHADLFRIALSEWKEKELDGTLGNKQDTLALNTYLKKTKELYEAMKDYIEINKTTEGIDENLRKALGDPTEFSTDTRINVLHTLFRDLIEFPFTYDTTLINSFQGDEVFQTEIVGNK